MTNLLYGMHDREGRHIVPAGGWCVDTRALARNDPPTDYAALRGDINWIVRLNWGYGSEGTIPLPVDYDNFAARCANYVAKSNGANIWIIGNEPNHENERPNGVYVTPEQYARCFTLCRDAIKRVNSNAQVIPAPAAPYHANPISWLDYWREMLTLIAANGGCDGLAIHAYTRSSDPADINDDVRMGPPLEDTCSGFLTYQDALEVVPAALRHLPAYLTEFNELLEGGWHDANTGVVQVAYRHINWWNTHAADANDPKFQCLILYRWPTFDKWHIEGKQGVIDDFRAAVALGFESPGAGTAETTYTLYMPAVSSGSAAEVPTAPALPPREWDERLTERGVTVETPPVAPGQAFWRVVKARWYDEQEADALGPDHHIMIDVLNSDGKRIVAQAVRVKWPTDSTLIFTESKSGEQYAVGYGMSPSRNEYGVSVEGHYLTERIVGIGMGADTPSGFNAGIHTSTGIVFQLVTMPNAAPAPPQPPPGVPVLAHPVQDPAKRVISQRFGDNPADYARFNLAGHNGVDFAVPEGTVVCAVDAGVVLEAGELADYGMYIKMRHVWGESVYAHLSRLRVEPGMAVGRGEPIALSGNTGNSTGPHLHFAVRVFPYVRGYPYDGFVDPAPYLINAGAPTQPTPTPAPTGDLAVLLKTVAKDFGLQWQLFAALAWNESSWRPEIDGGGLFQIGDDTWSDWAARVGATDRANARDNARVGAVYFRYLLRRYNGDERKAIWAWNFGPSRIDDGQTPPAITQEHASKILACRDFAVALKA